MLTEENPMASVSNPEPHILALEGEIDLHESPHVKEQINPLIEQKLPKVFIDLSGVSYIDSSGIAVFIEAMQRIQAYGGKLGLFGIRKSVQTIFEIARLDQVFRIFPDKAAAESGL
jgi:anti-sigma B factor antagonist